MSVEWFRSWHGAPLDPKWRTIAKRAKVPTCIVSSVAWALMDRASQSDDRGSIVGVDIETLADFLDCEPEQIARVIDAMREKGVLDGDRFLAWDKRQPKRERDDDSSASRVEAHRLRKKINELEAALHDMERHVTPCNATQHHVTPMKPMQRLDKEESREDKIQNTEIVETFLGGLVAPPSAPRKAKRAKPRTQIDENAQPSDRDREAAADVGLSADQFRVEWRKFRDHHRAKGSLMADWGAAWRKWIGNIPEFQRANARAGPAPHQQTTDPIYLAAAKLMGEANGERKFSTGGDGDAGPSQGGFLELGPGEYRNSG